MTGFVLDANVAVAFFVRDRATSSCDALLERLLRGEAHVPPHWPLEVANALLKSARRARLPDVASHVEMLTLESLARRATIHPMAAEDLRSVLDLARTERLSSYDAAHLALTERLDLPLATLDGALRRAAAARGAHLLPATAA